MKKLYKALLISLFACALALPVAGMALMGNVNAEEPSTLWTGFNNSHQTVNEDGSSSYNTVGNGNAYNQSAYVTAKKNTVGNTSDYAWAFNFKATDNNSGNQPFTIIYGIVGGKQVNMTFYWQGTAQKPETFKWTNNVIGSENFSTDETGETTYTAKLFRDGAQISSKGPTTKAGFTAFPFAAAADFKPLGDEAGHDLVVRVTKGEGQAVIRIYYGTQTCDLQKLFYEFTVVSPTAGNTENSFVGFHLYNSEFTLTNPVAVDPAPAEPQPQGETNWVKQGEHANYNVAEDGTVSMSTAAEDDAFNQAVYLPASLIANDKDDYAWSFNFKTTDNNSDQPLTINFGIIGGGQVNLAFYWQTLQDVRGWTSWVLGGESFVSSAPETMYTLTTYKGGEQSGTITGNKALGAGDAIGLSIKDLGLKDMGAQEGHDLVVRVTKQEGGALVSIYYGTKTCEEGKLAFTALVQNASASATDNSFIGFKLCKSVFSLTKAEEVVPAGEPLPPDPIDPQPPVDESKTLWHKNPVAAEEPADYAVADDGTVSMSTVRNNNPFNQSVYVPATAHSGDKDDFAWAFNFKVKDNGSKDQPFTINFGVVDKGQVNVTFYWQGTGEARHWSNNILGGENFSSFDTSTYFTIATYKDGKRVQEDEGKTVGFTGLATRISDLGLLDFGRTEGHDLVVRFTRVNENAALVTLYYNTNTCSLDKLFYSILVESEGVGELDTTFMGFHIYQSEFSVTNPTEVTVPDEDPLPPEEEPPVDEEAKPWTILDGEPVTNFENWNGDTLEGSFEIDDRGATIASSGTPQLAASLKTLAGGTIDPEKDYAVTTTIKIGEIGKGEATETRIALFLYMNKRNSVGTFLQYTSQWLNAFSYSKADGASTVAYANSASGAYASGDSMRIVDTALSLNGILTGRAGEERTFVTLFTLLESRVWVRIYLKSASNAAIDFTTATPLYQVMIDVPDISAWALENASFAMRVYNAKATVSGVHCDAVQHYNDTGIRVEASVTGDPGIWQVNDSLIAADYTFAADGSVTIDDTKSSTNSYGVPGISASFDDLAGSLDYTTAKDYVVGFNVKLSKESHETALWFGLSDDEGNFISLGMFCQFLTVDYFWTNGCVFSNVPASGYAYEKFGKTTKEFTEKSGTFEGVQAVAGLAFQPWDREEGHGFYVRFTYLTSESGENRLVLRVYYDEGKGVNFAAEEAEVYRVVLYDVAFGDYTNFHVRGQNTEATFSNFTMENFTTLYDDALVNFPDEPDEPDEPDNPDDPDTPDNPSEPEPPAEEGGCGGYIGGGLALVLGFALVGLVALKKRKDQ